jgi:hypothetical protein
LRQLFTERYRERLARVLSCYDGIIVTGTLPEACYAKGMTRVWGQTGSRPVAPKERRAPTKPLSQQSC